MAEFDVVTELRAKWCCILEEELECPVCFEISTSAEIIQCINSHNVCSNCRVNLSVCPTCDGQFLTTRNRTMEKLIKQFAEIKASLMDPEGDKNQRINLNKKSVSCQTDPEPKIPTVSVKSQTKIELQKSIDTQYNAVDFIKKEKNPSNNSTDSHNTPELSIKSQTTRKLEKSIGTQYDAVDFIKKEKNSSTIPKLEFDAEEIKPSLRRSSRIKAKISQYSINQR